MLEFVTGIGFRTEAAHQRPPSAQGLAGLAGLVVANRETLHVEELQNGQRSPGVTPEFPGEDFQSYYGVPLLAKGARLRA